MEINHHKDYVLDLEETFVIIWSDSIIILEKETELQGPYVHWLRVTKSVSGKEKPGMPAFALPVQCLFHD